ncbi:MAG: hypothetical protein JKY65_16315 [Planctomycetes bacterium]|nr:hypothetical protein [Planctomycetota bacterium]
MSDHELSAADLFQWQLGCVDPARAPGIEAHLASCETCTESGAEVEEILSALALPDLVPSPSRWHEVASRIEADLATKAPRILLNCSFCHDGLNRGEAVYCAACLAPHHEECFQDHGTCSLPGCGSTEVVRSAQIVPEREPERRRLPLILISLAGLAIGAAAFGLTSKDTAPPKRSTPSPAVRSSRSIPSLGPAKGPRVRGTPRVLPQAEGPRVDPTPEPSAKPTRVAVPEEPDGEEPPAEEPPPEIYGDEPDPQLQPGDADDADDADDE